MCVKVPKNITKIRIINTSGGLPIDVLSESGYTYLGCIIIREKVTEICMCDRLFRETIKNTGLKLCPARHFGADLVHIPTHSEPDIMYIQRYDRVKSCTGEVRIDFTQTNIPSLRDLAIVHVHSLNLTAEQLRSWYSPEIVGRICMPTKVVQHAWTVNKIVCYNCSEMPQYSTENLSYLPLGGSLQSLEPAAGLRHSKK